MAKDTKKGEKVELYGIFYCVPEDDEGGHGGTNGIYDSKESLFQAWKEILFENQYEHSLCSGGLDEFSIEGFEEDAKHTFENGLIYDDYISYSWEIVRINQLSEKRKQNFDEKLKQFSDEVEENNYD